MAEQEEGKREDEPGNEQMADSGVPVAHQVILTGETPVPQAGEILHGSGENSN